MPFLERALDNGGQRALIFAGLAAVLLGPVVINLGATPYPPGSAYSDIALQHWPLMLVARQALWQFGQWPLWNPSIYGGQPLAADPLVGLWYPPNWTLLAGLPLPLGFNLLFWGHGVWAGWAMYGWQRWRGRGVWAALLAAVVTMGLPKLTAHYGAGHIGLSMAVGWTPALLRAVELGRDAGRESAWGGARVGLIVALIFLADPRWAVYASGVAGVVWLAGTGGWPNWRAVLPAMGAGVVGALGLSAVSWLPLVDFVSKSAREGLTLAEANRFALGAVDVLGVILPRYGSPHELQTYLGLGVVGLAVVGFRRRERRTWVWAGLALGGLWWSLGAQAGLFALAFEVVPGVSLLRVPSRGWFVVALAVAVLAADGLDGVLAAGLDKRVKVVANLVCAGLGLAGVGLGVGALALSGEVAGAAPFLGLGLGALWLWVVINRGGWRWVWALVAVELAVVNVAALEMRAPAQAEAVMVALAGATGRVYSPSVSVPPLAAVQAGVMQLDGVNPLQLQAAVDVITPATGVPRDGYRETIPTFDVPEPPPGLSKAELDAWPTEQTVNAAYSPDAAALAELGVQVVVSAFPIEVAGLTLVTEADGQWVYTVDDFAGLATFAGGSAEVEVVGWTPTWIAVDVAADGPGTLTVAVFNDGHWRARVGVDGAWQAVEGPLLAVAVPARVTRVAFVYQPWPVWVGLAVSVVSVLLYLGVWRWMRRRAA